MNKTYTQEQTKSGTIHQIWWADGVRQGRICSAAPIKMTVAPVGAQPTCKVCIAKIDARPLAEIESTGGVDSEQGIGVSSEAVPESTGGIVADEQQAEQQETTGATALADKPATPRRRRATKAAPEGGPTVVDQVPTSDVILDPDIQPREHMNTQVISEYKEAMEAGAEFPPVVIFRGEDGKLFAADGFHRVNAAKAAEKATILAEIRPGGKRDAILYSVGTNATHGLRRTDADKRRAVMRLLNDKEWKKWSAGVIAEKVGVSQPFVSGLRKSLEGGAPTEVQTADGRTMNTGRIGRQPRGKAEDQATPPAPTADPNGHAPVVQDADDLLAGATDAPTTAPAATTEATPLETFTAQLKAVVAGMGTFDPKEVLASMGDDDLNAFADNWDAFVDALDNYSTALEEALA